jgi:hypothetical protein
MVKQARAAVALARTSATNYTSVEDGNRATFDGIAEGSDHSTGPDPAGTDPVAPGAALARSPERGGHR